MADLRLLGLICVMEGVKMLNKQFFVNLRWEYSLTKNSVTNAFVNILGPFLELNCDWGAENWRRNVVCWIWKLNLW